jgi:hypothetical protein
MIKNYQRLELALKVADGRPQIYCLNQIHMNLAFGTLSDGPWHLRKRECAGGLIKAL